MTDPIELTPLEQHWDALLRMDNRERYVQQSAATVAGQTAPYPGREPMQGLAQQFNQMFGG